MKDSKRSVTKLKAQPEKKRTLVMWLIIGATMLVIFSLWVLSLKWNLKLKSAQESRPNPELKEMKQDLKKTLEELERGWRWMQQTKIKEPARELKNDKK